MLLKSFLGSTVSAAILWAVCREAVLCSNSSLALPWLPSSSLDVSVRNPPQLWRTCL